MTNISQLRKEKEEKIEQEQQDILNVSTVLYQKQKSSIMAISDSTWFKTIKDFWILQKKQANNALEDVRFSDLQELGRVQSKAQMAKKFLLFLDNLEK